MEIDYRDIRRHAYGQTAAVDIEYPGGIGGHFLNNFFERQCARMDKPGKYHAKRVLKPYKTGSAFLDVVSGVRGVVGGNGVYRAVFQAFQQRLAVFYRTQRRVGLGRCAVGVFTGLIQQQVVRRYFTGDVCDVPLLAF